MPNKVVDMTSKYKFMRFLRNDIMKEFKPKQNVQTNGNDVYLDGAIVDSDTARMINEDENEWGYPCISSDEMRNALAPLEGKINLFVNSPGGDVFEGSRMLTVLEQKIASGAEITLIVDGLCASAATYLLVAEGLSDRLITKFSQVMIHEVWVGCVGNATELREMADVLESTDAEYARLLAAIMPDTDEEQVRALMAAETWLTAEAAIESGLIKGYYTAQETETEDTENNTDASDNEDNDGDDSGGLLSNRLRLLNQESQRILLGF